MYIFLLVNNVILPEELITNNESLKKAGTEIKETHAILYLFYSSL